MFLNFRVRFLCSPIFKPLITLFCLYSVQMSYAVEKTNMPSVIVSKVVSKDVTPKFTYVGRTEAIDKVDMLARVEGFLEQRSFQEGANVSEGDLLFVIEKASYEITVQQRRAELLSAEANLKNAKADLKRKKELRKKKAISQADLDTAEANEVSAEASVLMAKATLKRAELDLSYTDIKSPINGQISRSNFSVGNLVGPNTDTLATVMSLDPIYVMIAISEKVLINARRIGIDLNNPRVEPSLQLSDGSAYNHVGYFDYLDTQVNQSTDTILGRAVFPNPDKLLVPGQFVKVTVKQKEAVSALTVPQVAMQEDRQGFFVLVVDKENKVEMRRVEVGDQLETDWVINSGLAVGERVIVQGVQKVQADMEVNPVSDPSGSGS